MHRNLNSLFLFILFIFTHPVKNTLAVNTYALNIPPRVQWEDSHFINYYGGFSMYKNKDPTNPDFLFKDGPRFFSSLEPDEERLALEQELRRRNLLYDPDVQWLVTVMNSDNGKNSQWARDKVRMILESERIVDMRTADVFRPLAPPQLLSCGNLHLYNQVDGSAWMVPADTLTRGMIVTGPQGGGKTRLLIWLAKQLSGLDPPIPFFILDPKMGLKDWADYLGATYIDVSEISFDLSPPPGLIYQQWLPSLMPQLGEIIGVIYGVEILQEAANICIELRDRYIKETTKSTEISLVDLYQALPFVSGVSSGRRAGYRDALSTGLSRILSGSGDLFKCRKGIDLTTLFNSNIILGCRSVTDDFAVKFIAFYLLYYLYESERFSPPTDKLKRVLILDDATRFLAARTGFEAASATSSFTHIFAHLRSSGNGVIYATQVPHLADAGVLALSHVILCVGGLHYAKDTKLLSQIMSLNEQQRLAITQLGKREAIGICAGSAWPKVIHGYTVDVPDLQGKNNG